MCRMHETQIDTGYSPILPVWFESEAGQDLLQQQVSALGRLVPDQFYKVGLQLGAPDRQLLAPLNVEHSIYCDRARPDNAHMNVIALPEALPLPESSVDLALLLHTLDYCGDPHRALREIAQTMSPEGVLVLSGFHPYSLWGARRKLGAKTPPFDARFIARAQAQDWLELLGFQHIAGCMINYQLPQLSARWRARLSAMEPLGDRWWPTLGAVYILVARKKVYSRINKKHARSRAARWFPGLKPAQVKVARQNRPENERG